MYKLNYLICLFTLCSIELKSQDTVSNNHKGNNPRIDVAKQKDLNPLKAKLFIPPTEKFVFIDFVGSGDIQKSISEGEEIKANTGIGIIFEKFNGTIDDGNFIIRKPVQSLELEAFLNIASTADTIHSKVENNTLQNQRSFGSYILNPISVKQSLFLNSNLYFGYPENWFGKIAKVISGINFRVISSNNIWQYENQTVNISAIAYRMGIFHEFIPDNYRLTKEGRSKYSIFLGLNYAYRGIFGDITASKNDNLREKFLGSIKKNFSGAEINFGFRLNNLRAEFQMPMLKGGDKSIDGLTNTQFQFSIKFVGGFALKLTTEK